MIVGKCYESSLEHSYIKDPLLPLLVGGFYFINYQTMQKTDGSITSNIEGGTREDYMFTYSEDEKQQNTINKTHAELVLHPKFIPMYPELLEQGFSLLESCLYGFIDFFLSNNDRFYWSNSKLAELFKVGETNISLGIKKLKDLGIIDVNYRIKAGGGKVRFINLTSPTFRIGKSDIGNLKGIYNKIIDNKIIDKSLYKYNDSGAENLQPLDTLSPVGENPTTPLPPSSRKRQDIDELITEIKAVCNEYGIAYDKTKDRMFAKHILDGKEIGTFCDNIGQSRMNFAVNVLIASIKINYFKGACSGPMKIYQNYAEVYNQTAMKHNKQSSLVGFLPGLNIG